MHDVTLTIETNEFQIKNIDYKNIVIRTLEEINFEQSCEISIIFVDDQYMSELNNQYRGYANSTDVLSFESGDMNPETGAVYLGDIVISFPFVNNQAINLGNRISDEISLMVIHGVLHICGFDHSTEEEKDNMWDLQSKILNQLDIHLTKLPE